MRVQDLRDIAEGLFSKRSSLLLLWQEQAENFYPQRADFTFQRVLGTDMAGNLMTSYPILCQRDLQDQIGTMLRPTAKEWFHSTIMDDSVLDNDSRAWLQWADRIMRRAMYDRAAQFQKAMKEGDGDYSAFGNAVTSIRLNKNMDGLLYRTHHLRDVVWREGADGIVNLIARRWKPTARDLFYLFGNRCDPKVSTLITQGKPFEEIDCLHFIVEAELYDGHAGRNPWFSIHYDVVHDHIMEEVPTWHKEYAIERWQTVSGSQYAYSPCTVAALPEARLIQAMTYTLLEAGEKATNPPMVATHDVVRSDVAIFAGGITWVDRDYDERLGDALRPLTQDLRGLPFGAESQRDSRALLSACFYLNKLSLPARGGPDMTAYEVGQRVQEYIRGALPLFEPMETERNGQICEMTWQLLFRHGAFGSPYAMPKKLHGQETQFTFQSPLHDIIDAQKATTFQEMSGLIAQAVQLDQGIAAIPDAVTAIRDVLNGIGVPAKWMRSEVQTKDIQRQQQAAQNAMQTLQALQVGSGAVKNLADAHATAAQANPGGQDQQAAMPVLQG
jgi:hypothetical protein